ncbi:MAG: hypothetical protein HQL69_20550 [Magnetococcales bacterium]|nr:hypothetical protein [Magnetococcales bacterium]
MIQLIPIAAVGGYVCAVTARKFIAKKRAATAANLKPGASMIHFVKEFVEEEEEIILAVEDIPLNNRHSSTQLISEFSFVRSATTQIKVQRDKEQHFGLDSDMFSVLKKHTNAHLKRVLNLDLQSETRREIKLRLTAAPHTDHHYRVIWKQQGKRGFQEVEVGGKFYQIPFLVTHGLSATVDTIQVEQISHGVSS